SCGVAECGNGDRTVTERARAICSAGYGSMCTTVRGGAVTIGQHGAAPGRRCGGTAPGPHGVAPWSRRPDDPAAPPHRRPGTPAARDRGSVTPLVIGMVLCLLLLGAGVTAATSAFLARQNLQHSCDSAADAATNAARSASIKGLAGQ